MAGTSAIEWTDATWNPLVGCSIYSPGCKNCFAMRDAWRMHRNPRTPHYHGLTEKVNGQAVWTGRIARAPAAVWRAPLAWQKPRRIFVNSMGDLFHENISQADIDDVFIVMVLAHEHEFQVLTKRAERMREYICDPSLGVRLGGKMMEFARGDVSAECGVIDIAHRLTVEGKGLRNVLLGVSVERQREADARREALAQVRRAGWRTFVSYEPALEAVNWRGWEFIQWMISGGESGSNARPSHPQWHGDTLAWCRRFGVRYFFKQWGEWAPFWFLDDGPPKRTYTFADGVNLYRIGKQNAPAVLDNANYHEFPIREAV